MEEYRTELDNIYVQTVSMCTMRCWHCAYGAMPISPQIMPEAFVLRLVDELADINYSRRLTFYGVNEPLLDPRIQDFISYARKKLPLVRMVITSNGDLATIDVVGRLLNAGAAKVNLTIHDEAKAPNLLKIKEYFPNGVTLIDHSSPEKTEHFHNVGGLIKASSVQQRRYRDRSCALPFRQMILYSDCTLGLCCGGYSDDFRIRIDEAESILDIYNKNAELNRYRNMLKSNKRDMFPCSDCSYEGHYNLSE